MPISSKHNDVLRWISSGDSLSHRPHEMSSCTCINRIGADWALDTCEWIL